MLGLLAAAASWYPAPWQVLAPPLLIYAALLYWRPALWLLLVPAALPVLDLAPWTGSMYLEELDLLLLTSTAVCYWRLAPCAPAMRLPPAMALTLALFALMYMIAAWRGLAPLPPLDADAFANYTSRYNSLRMLKGVLWALLLLPLLRRSPRKHLQHWFVPGMLLGLALSCLVVAWERKLFPGLLNFSSNYRPTGAFSAMHTGGAALDAYLAMALPFTAAWIAQQPSQVRQAVGLLCLALGLYAGLALFSRDIYLAFAAAGAVLAAAAVARRKRSGRLQPRRVAGAIVLIVLAALVLDQVFTAGGYRALLAAVGLLGCALAVAGTAREQGGRRWPFVLALLLLAAAAGLAGWLSGPSGKGAYLGYTLAASCALIGVLLQMTPRYRARGLGMLLAAFPALALAALLVSHHWGGAPTLPSSAAVVTLAAALALCRWLPTRPLRLGRSGASAAVLAAIVLLLVIPVTNSYFAGVRFAHVAGDLQLRLRHWSEALAMMRDDAATQLLGMGLGTYPATYFWNNRQGETPPSVRYGIEDGAFYLRLGAPRYLAGYGEVLRMLQRVRLVADREYTVSLSLRRPDDSARLRLAFCQRWLLYPQNCLSVPLTLKKGETGWRRYSARWVSPFDSTSPLVRPVQLELANEGQAWLDVRDLQVTDETTGQQILQNGDFSTSWFFSSDHHHLPWHIKNLAVNAVFETGWLGALALGALLLAATRIMGRRALAGDWHAAIVLASLAGAMAVGLFDSIVDVPRLTTLLLLLLAVGTLRDGGRPGARRALQ